MSLGLLWSLDNGQGNVLTRFEQTLGRGAVGVAPWIASIQAGHLGPLSRQLTAADTFQQCQDSQGD